MDDIKDLHARLRRRVDKDIQQAVKRLRLNNLIEDGEISDWVRDGFRLKLIELGAMEGGKFSDSRYFKDPGNH